MSFGSRRRLSLAVAGVGAMLAMVAASPVQAAWYLGPQPYLQASDSPFSGPFDWFHLENFESGAIAVPGVTVTTGAVVIDPGPLTDSVDADDGAIDGSGRGGHSLYSGGTLNAITFRFDKTLLGALPTHAGIVVTDIGASDRAFGEGRIRVTEVTELPLVSIIAGSSYGSAFGGSLDRVAAPAYLTMSSSGTIVDSRTGLPFTGDIAEGSVPFGDAAASGATAEDRFFGVVDPLGIEALMIISYDSIDWEIDHLQFGFSAETAALVSEPSTVLAVVAAIGGLFSASAVSRRPAMAGLRRR